MSAWNYVIQIIASQKKQNAARNAESQAQQTQIAEDTRVADRGAPLSLPNSKPPENYSMTTEMAHSGLKSFTGPFGVTGASDAATGGDAGEGMGGGGDMTGALEGGMEAYGPGGAGPAGELGDVSAAGGAPAAPERRRLSVPAEKPPRIGGRRADANIDVFGGEEYGARAQATTENAGPAVSDYVKNAMQEYVRQKMAKKFGGIAGVAAAAANSGEEGSQGEFGKDIHKLAAWLNETPQKKRARRKETSAQP